MQGCATVVWLDLTSPFGASPTGVDWSIELPEGCEVLDLSRRPRFFVGPDAHRPRVSRDGRLLELSFTGFLPGDNHRRPMANPDNWCDLHFPLVLIADSMADGQVIQITRRAMGDSDEREVELVVHDRPSQLTPPTMARCMQLLFFPWFTREEQEVLAQTLARCGISDCSLNWHNNGQPLLPIDAYALSARILRKAIPGVRVWIGGLPGADTPLPRAEALYGHHIPFVASPEAAIHDGPDLVVASERSWCEATGADGVMIALSEPSSVDTDAMPAHCFTYRSRRRFTREFGLPAVPDPLTILQNYREAWVEFACRQMRRLLELARHGHGDRRLAVCAYGPGGPARAEASVDWRELSQVADVLVYTHQEQSEDDGAEHWGYTRVGGTPQAWWERWHDPLGTIDDSELVVADAKMQLAFSGSRGVRIGSWACLDGRLQQRLMEWR